MDHTWCSRRSSILSTKAICSSSQPSATAAGIKILQQGGNAADAGVAMAAALNVTEPCSTGIGGDAFALYYDAKTKKVTCLQGNGASVSKFTMDYLNSIGIGEGLNPLDPKSGLCITVPGAAALWEDLLKQHGTLTLKDVLQPAISLAEDGFPVHAVTAQQWSGGGLQGEEAHRVYRPHPITTGTVFKNPDLAMTFRTIAELGVYHGFYSGRIAESIVQAVQEYGGVITLEDLATHRTAFEEAISINYHGIQVYQTPPPSQGLAVLLALQYLQAWERKQKAASSTASSTAGATDAGRAANNGSHGFDTSPQ